MLINIITIALGVILGIIMSTVLMMVIATSKTFMKWYTKKVIKTMGIVEETCEENEFEI